MPTYEYVCGKCEHEFEVFQSIKDEPIKTCPECKSKKAHRLISSGAGIIFKGSGFYETDYKRKAGSKESLESQSKDGEAKKSGETGDKKNEKKAENKSSDSSKKDTNNKAA